MKFLHRADKTIAGMSQTTAMVIGALKAIGRENVTEEHIKRLKRRLPAEAKELLIEEGRHTSHYGFMTGSKRFAKRRKSKCMILQSCLLKNE